MRKLKLIAAAVGTSLLIVGVSMALPVQTRPQPAFAGAGASDKQYEECTPQATQGRCADKPLIDHSGCQYPDRWSNPAYACDNSDPAVPECIGQWDTRQMEQDCITAFVAQHNQQPTTATTPAPTNTNQCGGK